MDKWYRHKDVLRRKFTVMALRNSEVLKLSIADLNRMRTEFPEQYVKMFDDSLIRMKKALLLKRKAIKICEEKQEELSQTSMNSSGFYDRELISVSGLGDISGKVSFTKSENIELIKDEIDYGL